MKIATLIVGALLGALFLFAGGMHFFGPPPPPDQLPPAGSDAAKFMALFASTGYLSFVKVFELIGGLLVAIPKTRNLGLLVLGPIIINILCFTFFIGKGLPVMWPMIGFLVIAPLFLLWAERRAFAGLVTRRINLV
jgi:uncharacterized membrane protein YphA (DoxX/SURF4 family)